MERAYHHITRLNHDHKARQDRVDYKQDKTSKCKVCDSVSTQNNYRGTAADTPRLKKVHGSSEKPKEFINSFDQEID